MFRFQTYQSHADVETTHKITYLYALLLVDCSLQDNHSNFFGAFFVITDIYHLVLWNHARTGTANSYVHTDLMSCKKQFPLTPTSKRYFPCLYTLHLLNSWYLSKYRYPPVKLHISPPSYTLPVTTDISAITISGYPFIDLKPYLRS